MSEKKPRQIRVGTLVTAGLLLFAASATVSAAIVTHVDPASSSTSVTSSSPSAVPSDTPPATTTADSPGQDTSTVTTPEAPAATTAAPAPAVQTTTAAPNTMAVEDPALTPVPPPPPVPVPVVQRPPKPTCREGEQPAWVGDVWVCASGPAAPSLTP